MEAKDLMVGDYVYNHRNWECPIVEIHKNSAVVIARHYGEEEFLLSDLRPIPLTAEILEKNGFQHHLIAEKGFTREEWTLSDDYYDIVVREWSDSIWVFRYECTEMNTPHEQRVFGYVHELQHALRENGIDKEIVI